MNAGLVQHSPRLWARHADAHQRGAYVCHLDIVGDDVLIKMSQDAFSLPAFGVDQQRFTEVMNVKIALDAPLRVEQKGINAVIRTKIAHVVSGHAIQPTNPVATTYTDLRSIAEVIEA